MSYPIEVRYTKERGRGVFALKDFEVGELIEKCPVIQLTTKERPICEKTILNFYIYPWKSLNDAVIVLGYGCIYNHSSENNAKWVRLIKSKKMAYRAVRPIKSGEEILIDYNGEYEPDDMDWLTPDNQR